MTNPEVSLVDDDPAVLQALRRGLEGAGFKVRTWQSPLAFLEEHDDSIPGCLVVDYAMPEMNGFELHQQLTAYGMERAIVFITAHGDIPMSVHAMRTGAVSFLPKPVRLATLIDAIREALARDEALREERRRKASLETRINALTPREMEVLELVVSGKMNKQIAGLLGTSEKTIKVHRGRAMHKMHVRSVAELVLMSAQAGIAPLLHPTRT
jgi:FixJ family two-component response regulator